MGEDIWGQVWATLWRGSCEDCGSVSFLNLIQRALTPAIFIRFTSKMAWYSPDAVAVEDNHETQTKSWTLQWFWLGLESGLICFCICEKRPVPEYPNELGEVVLSIQLGGKWWGLRSSLPGLIPFAFVCKREKQHRLIWSTNLPMCKVHKMRQHYTIRIDSPFLDISGRFTNAEVAESSPFHGGFQNGSLVPDWLIQVMGWNQSIWSRQESPVFLMFLKSVNLGSGLGHF